jgi:hypothetical protein
LSKIDFSRWNVLDAAKAGRPELTEPMAEAVEACRRGRWADGLPALARLAEEGERGAKLPAIVYSYLGYGVALRQQRLEDGVKLCRHAVKLAFYDPEGYLNLARTLLLAQKRRNAIRVVQEGLSLVPDHEGLLELHAEMGRRRSPVLRFLSREHPVNLFLGRIRHTLRS